VRRHRLWLCCLFLATNVALASAQQSGPGVLPGSQPLAAGGTVSGGFRVADGNADGTAAGGYSWASDTNTVIYRIGADNVGFSAGGVLRWDYNTTRILSTIPFQGAVGSAGTPTFLAGTAGIFSPFTNYLGFSVGGGNSGEIDTTAWRLPLAFELGWAASGGTLDLRLARDVANQLALRNGTNPQAFNLYNTFTSSTIYERAESTWTGNVFYFGTRKGSGGGSARSMSFITDGQDRWNIGTTGNITAGTDNTYAIGNGTGALLRPSSIFLAAPGITIGSGTGITVGNAGEVRDLDYVVTIASTAFVCAATTCDVTIGTLPAKTLLYPSIAEITTTFACTATCTSSTLSFLLGKGSGGAEYLASFDADAATGVFGDADAELGTLLTRAAAIANGTYHTTSQAVVLRLTSGTGNIGNGAATNLSQGSVTITLRHRVKG
jgi:hypothetical protein